MAKRLCLLLLAALLSVSCNTVTRLYAPATTPSPNESEAEYAVYRAVIEDMFEVLRLGTVVIRDHTDSGLNIGGDPSKEFEYIQKSLPEVDAYMKDSFLARNAEAMPLEDRFNLGIPVTLLNQNEFDGFFGKSGNGWEAFYLEYPQSQGVLILSRVAFNRRGDKALVCAGNQAHYLAGAGYALVLGWEDSQWKVLNRVMLWIS